MLFATFLVTAFGYTFSVATPVHAADPASWDGNNLTYQDHTYTPLDTSKTKGLDGLPAGAKVYEYQDKSGGDVTAYLIYFESGIVPKSATEAKYVQYRLNPPNRYSNPTDETTITLTPVETDTASTTSSCSLEGIGWIICPVSKAIAESMDFLYGVITQFFEVSLLTTNDGSLYKMWDVARSIANVLFAIGFLIMIYGQISGGVLSNYTIKKLLPRLIIAAVLVNISYWICAVAVDLSNILGFSAQDMLSSLRDFAGAPNSAAGETATPTWVNVTTAVLAGGGAAVIGASALIVATGTGTGLAMLLLAALLPAIFAAIVAVAVLAARQALITVFIILSPLAFAAYILPNTEEWFTRWRKLFMNMLIMFPAFSVIFGGAQLAGTLIIQNTDSIIVVILGMTVQIVPLFITPFLIKLSSGLLSTIANITNDKSKGVFDRTKNWADTRRGQEQAIGARKRAERALRDGHPGKYKTTRSRSRMRRGLSYTGHRLNPYDRAYAKDYTRMKREGMKSADEAFAAGAFTGTAAGRGIDYRNRDASSIKHVGESANARSYNTAVATGTSAQDAYRRDLHHQAHVDEGIGNLAEENLKAGGEQHLREEILRTPSLVNMSVQTNELSKRAEQAKAIVDDQANAHWEELTLNDRGIYTRQLQRQSAAKQIKAAQEQWESILVEAAAGRTDDYQGKFGPITFQVADAVSTIQSADKTIAVEALRKSGAEYVGKVELNKALKADAALLGQAAGIDEEGNIKVLAKLQKEASGLYMENVEAAKSVFTNDKDYSLSKLKSVYRDGVLADGTTPATVMQRHAALQRVIMEVGNNYAVQEAIDFSNELGVDESVDSNGNVVFKDIYGNELSDEEVDSRRDTQQIINDAYAKSALKVDWYSGTDRGLAETGRYIARDPSGKPRTDLAASELSIAAEINKGKVDYDRAYNADIDVIDKQARVLAKPEVSSLLDQEAAGQYADTLEEFLKDPYTGMKLEKRKRGSYHVLLKELRARAQGQAVDLTQLDTSYVDVANGENVQVLAFNRISTKPTSSKPQGPIKLT